YQVQNTKFTIENNIIKGVEEPCPIKNKSNFGQVLFDSISEYGNRVARIQVETGEQRSYKEIKDRSVRCALWLKKQGIGAEDVVVVCTDNQLDACIPTVAAVYVGAALNGWVHDYGLEQYRYYMNFLRPKVIFSCQASVSLVQEAAKLENVVTKIIVYGKYTDLESLSDIMGQLSEDEVHKFRPEEKFHSLDPAVIMFSSGSSGTPKAVALGYGSLLENILSFCPTGRVVALYYSSLMWISGVALTFNFLLTGSTVIVHENFNPRETFKIIEEYEINWTFLSPLALTRCYKENILSDYKLLSLKTILTGSAPLNSTVYRAFKDRYPHVTILFTYGLSELGSLATCNLGQSINSIGFIKPNRQLKVVDVTTRKPLGPNEEGELCLKSAGMMIGYYKNPIDTSKIIDEEGWLHTGDLGYYNEDGEIFFVERIKELMRWRSSNVYPIEFERLLLEHPGVSEVAVVPVPDDVDGDRPMAFVKKYPGTEVNEEELIELSSAVGKGLKLWGGVKFVDELPRSVSGKVLRHKLKELAKTYKKEL
ncbi:hypothetical protein TSAR_014622, partial [Trichomalopsis sarcophagae]